MTVNPYFRRNKKGEQTLIESLTTEAIKIHGHDMVYIPRETVKEDFILGEEVSQFTDANRIEMYMENAEGYEGDSEMSRFGLDVRESATFIVSRKRFMDVMGHHKDIQKNSRPREGDLLYFDYPSSLFEIKFVEHDNPFYPGGELYSFKLSCEAFKYSNEKVETGETRVDSEILTTSDYLVGITLGTGNGTYTVGEEVYTGTVENKLAYGRVNLYSAPVGGTKFMRVNKQEGVFKVDDLLIGLVSGASYTIDGVYKTTVRATHEDNQDNEQLEVEENSDNIFDFTETDPFSEGNY